MLLLTQMQDKLAFDVPTQAYSIGSKEYKPNTSGLYEQFNNDEIVTRLEALRRLGIAV